MSNTIKSTLWRIALIIMTLAFWANIVMAQDEAEVVEEATTNYGIIWAILLAGLGAVALLGFAMNSRDKAEDEN